MKRRLFSHELLEKVVVHVVFAILAYNYLFRFSYEFARSRYLDLLNNATDILIFYLHTFLLLPVLSQKKNLRLYILMVVISYCMAAIAKSWISASHSSLIVVNPDGSAVNPLHYFLRNDWIFGHVLSMLPRYFIIGLISVIYYRLYVDVRRIIPYLELIVNVLVVSTIFYLLVGYAPGRSIVWVALGCFSIMLFYLNAFWLFPNWQKRRKIGAYLVVISLLSTTYFLIANWILGSGLGEKYQLTNENFFPFHDHQKWYLIVICLVIILATSSFYAYMRNRTGINQIPLKLQLKAKEAELSLLKAQVNPHFLFNTLNTLYATALEENAPRTAESTAKLANLIRYMQEDMAKEFISLKSEVDYLKDYISIQKIRCEVEPRVHTNFTGIERYMISPGLFIPFVENAFKYGIDPSRPSLLNISIICNDYSISFSCTNSLGQDSSIDYREKGFGIGIENTRKRLALIYPEKHTFEIDKTERMFTVRISIFNPIE